MDEMKAWEDQERAVTLTNDEWCTLTCHINQTILYSRDAVAKWRTMAEEKKPDGTPKFPNALKKAIYWQEVIDTVERIIPKLNGMD